MRRGYAYIPLLVGVLVAFLLALLAAMNPHELTGTVIHVDCYEGWGIEPTVVLNTSQGKVALTSSRENCLLLSTEIGRNVTVLVQWDNDLRRVLRT